MALTFDDGPHPVYTRKILKILSTHHAKGTFFVTGQRAKKYPSILKEVCEHGHEIGNHTYSHPSMRKISSLALQEEIQRTDNIIYYSIAHLFYFVMPGGLQNAVVLDAARKTKHLIVLWSTDPNDWSNPGIERIVNRVTHHAQPGQIVLLHDSGVNRTQTVKALDRILDILSKQGYKFVTVSELIH
jgi:peptidoglycan-N-acetylglucosamine deacetylase